MAHPGRLIVVLLGAFCACAESESPTPSAAGSGGRAGDGGTGGTPSAGTSGSSGASGAGGVGTGGTAGFGVAGTGGRASGDAGVEPQPDAGPTVVIPEGQSLISDERPFDPPNTLAVDVWPVFVTTAVAAQGGAKVITIQDPGGGEDSGLVSLVPATVPSAATITAGDCVHLAGTYDLTSLWVSATLADVIPCVGTGPVTVSANVFDPHPELDGQRIRFSRTVNGIEYGWSLRFEDEEATHVDVFLVEGGSVSFRMAKGAIADIAPAFTGNKVLEGVSVANYPNIVDLGEIGIGPSLLLTAVTDPP